MPHQTDPFRRPDPGKIERFLDGAFSALGIMVIFGLLIFVGVILGNLVAQAPIILIPFVIMIGAGIYNVVRD